MKRDGNNTPRGRDAGKKQTDFTAQKSAQRGRWAEEGRCIICGRHTQGDRRTCDYCSQVKAEQRENARVSGRCTVCLADLAKLSVCDRCNDAAKRRVLKGRFLAAAREAFYRKGRTPLAWIADAVAMEDKIKDEKSLETIRKRLNARIRESGRNYTLLSQEEFPTLFHSWKKYFRLDSTSPRVARVADFDQWTGKKIIDYWKLFMSLLNPKLPWGDDEEFDLFGSEETCSSRFLWDRDELSKKWENEEMYALFVGKDENHDDYLNILQFLVCWDELRWDELCTDKIFRNRSWLRGARPKADRLAILRGRLGEIINLENDIGAGWRGLVMSLNRQLERAKKPVLDKVYPELTGKQRVLRLSVRGWRDDAVLKRLVEDALKRSTEICEHCGKKLKSTSTYCPCRNPRGPKRNGQRKGRTLKPIPF